MDGPTEANNYQITMQSYIQRQDQLWRDGDKIMDRCSSLFLPVLVLLGVGIAGAVIWGRAVQPSRIRTGQILTGIGFGGAILLALSGCALVRDQKRQLNIATRQEELDGEFEPLRDRGQAETARRAAEASRRFVRRGNRAAVAR
jgi:hypothetical protein